MCKGCFLTNITDMKNYFIIIVISILVSCSNSDQNEYEWQQKYLERENHRIEFFEINYQYENGGYKKEYESRYFKGFDSNNRLINYDNNHFYYYDSLGKLTKEEYCIRSCNIPMQEFYNYGKNDLLLNKKIYHQVWEDTLTIVEYDYDSGFLTEEVIGREEPFTTKRYEYDIKGRLVKKSVEEFNQNVDRWINYYDTIIYDKAGKKIRKDHFAKGQDLQKVTTYYYEGDNIIQEIDTAITSIETYKLTMEKGTVYHAYYGKREFKYDSTRKLIEKIIYQPDYKTPYTKIEFSEKNKRR